MRKVGKCTSCGGEVAFSPKTQNLVCKKCAKTFSVPVNPVVYHKVDLYEVVKDETSDLSALKLRCMDCGAPVSGDTITIAGVCPYCGSHLVEDFGDKLSVSPDGIIPFAFDKDDCKKKVYKVLSSKAFAPNDLRSGKVPIRVESLYVPTYHFRCLTDNQYDGKLEDRDEDSEGNTIYRSYHISGSLEHKDEDIIIECSKNMTQIDMEKILPFDTTKVRKFANGYISGYSVEYLNEKFSSVKKYAREINASHIRREILFGRHYDRVVYLDVNTQYKDARYAYTILPTYKISYSYKNKVYSTFVNGQTGKMQLKYPKSRAKILWTIFGILGLIGISIVITLFFRGVFK